MIPPFITPSPSVIVNTYSFNNGTGVAADSNLVKSYTWLKPPGTGMVLFWVVGSGGDGFGPALSGTSGGGGGGGGAYHMCLIPAMFVPDSLVLQGPDGTAGTGNRIRMYDRSTNLYGIVGGGSTAISITGGGGGSIFGSQFNAGLLVTRAGVDGQNGGAAGVAGTDVASRVSFNAGGAGGGGTNASGGIVPVAAGYPYPVLTSAAVGANGATGYQFLSQLGYTTPGAGGGGGSALGGIGGAGAFGCGGGGGGGNTTGNGPSQGGRGGQGLVIIYSW